MVAATLNFLKPRELYNIEKPYFLNIPGSEPGNHILQTNLEYEPREKIEIQDLRQRDVDGFTLQQNGFQILQSNVTSMSGTEEDQIEAYCEKITAQVKKECGASHVLCYDYRIRRNNAEVIDYEKGQDFGRDIAAPPVYPVHIDHTVDGGPKRIRRHLTVEEAVKYMSSNFRARIINVWRPLDYPVEDCPIAICDPRSIDPRDLTAADRVTPDFAVELYYMRYNSNQKWYWLSNQKPDELTVFVNYDSECQIGGTGWSACPHAAFANPEAKSDAPKRSSIEVRLIVFNASLSNSVI